MQFPLEIVITIVGTLSWTFARYLWKLDVSLPYISSLAKTCPMTRFPFFPSVWSLSNGCFEPLSHLWALAAKKPGKANSKHLPWGGKPRLEIPQIFEVHSKCAEQPQNINVLYWNWLLSFKKKNSRSEDLNLLKNLVFNPEFVFNSNR